MSDISNKSRRDKLSQTQQADDAIEHAQPMSETEILARFGSSRTSNQPRRARVRRSRSRVVNLLWCLDKTGSMNRLIAQAKNASKSFFERMAELGITTEVSWCPYGDYYDYGIRGMVGLIEPGPWTHELEQLTAAIEATKLVGGGDDDEAVEYVLAHALTIDHQVDAVVLIGDANPHSKEEAERQVRQYQVPTDAQLDWRASALALAKAKRPVYSFPMRMQCRETFSEIARLSGGETGDLDDLQSLVDMLSVTACAVGGGGDKVRAYLARHESSMSRSALAYARRLHALPPKRS